MQWGDEPVITRKRPVNQASPYMVDGEDGQTHVFVAEVLEEGDKYSTESGEFEPRFATIGEFDPPYFGPQFGVKVYHVDNPGVTVTMNWTSESDGLTRSGWMWRGLGSMMLLGELRHAVEA